MTISGPHILYDYDLEHGLDPRLLALMVPPNLRAEPPKAGVTRSLPCSPAPAAASGDPDAVSVREPELDAARPLPEASPLCA